MSNPSTTNLDSMNAETNVTIGLPGVSQVVVLSEVGSADGLIQILRASVLYGVPPIMNAAGVALSYTAHIVTGVVVASGTTTSVTFSGAAVFTGAATFVALVVDLSVATGTYISCSVVAPNGISWTSVNGHEYVYLAIGY